MPGNMLDLHRRYLFDPMVKNVMTGVAVFLGHVEIFDDTSKGYFYDCSMKGRNESRGRR
jgi:hypothetical protein